MFNNNLPFIVCISKYVYDRCCLFFGYCFGYCLFEIFKYKNQKDDIIEFFPIYDKKYGSKIEIEGNILLGNDLSFEQKFLNNAVDKCSEEIEN